MRRKLVVPAIVFGLGVLCLAATPLRAQPKPTSELLLPYFEVGVTNKKTTVFDVTNTTDTPVEVELVLFTNWGVEVDRTPSNKPLKLKRREEKVIDLRDWIISHQRPGGSQVAPQKSKNVQAWLQGLAVNGKFRGQKVADGLAVGYVVIKVTKPTSRRGQRAICGDYFLVTPDKHRTEGEMMVDLADKALCKCHAVFLLKEKNFDDDKSPLFDTDTKVNLWTGLKGKASANEKPGHTLNQLRVFGFDGDGNRRALKTLRVPSTLLLPVDQKTINWTPEIRWLELQTVGNSFAAAHYFNDKTEVSAALRTCCIPCGVRPSTTTTTRPTTTTTKPTTTTTKPTTTTTKPTTTTTKPTTTTTKPTTTTTTPTTTTTTPTTTTTTPTTTTVAASQGCTPGYWKVPQHHDSWDPTGFRTGQQVQSVFSAASAFPQGTSSLVEALGFGGGGGVEGGVRNLLRAAVAGLLNSSHPDVNYPRTTSSLTRDVNAALASGDRQTMLNLASSIDRDNNKGCPLN